jgi:hypothetical protein
MRHLLFATLIVVANGCGGSESTTSRSESMADASTDAATDVRVCPFVASNYPQSCTVDTDCSVVTSGDYCSSQCMCGGSPINTTGLAQFNADISATPLGSGAIPVASCGCPVFGRVCCLSGTCKIDSFACDQKDTLAACADAGGSCGQGVVQCGKGNGPPNSCALPNETCCLN